CRPQRLAASRQPRRVRLRPVRSARAAHPSKSSAGSRLTTLLSPANSLSRSEFSMRVASFAAALVCAVLFFQPAAQAQTSAAGEQTGSIGVPVGGSQIMRFDRPVGRVYLGNSDVADVIALTDRSIYLLGKRAGTSSLTIMERGQRSAPMATYTVQVGV